MTNEELYERITSKLKEQGIAIKQFELKVKAETGKYPNIRITKSRLSLPNTVAFPYLTMFFNDDEMHELTLKKIDDVGNNGEAFDLLDELLYSLKPSKEYLYKHRLKRRMQREAMRWYYTNTHGKLIAQNVRGQQHERLRMTWTRMTASIII